MLAAPKPCRVCGKAVQGQNLCEACAKLPANQLGQNKRVHDDVDRMYAQVRWLTFREFIIHQRPICQKINKGIRCTNPAKIVHHLISPRRRPDLFTTASNVVALCQLDHPPTEGTPDWRAGVHYEPEPIAPLMIS